jgi:ABC-2 type transport system permease protein
MTTATTVSNANPASIGFANVLRSEWTKLRSVRSTYWTACAAAVAAIGLCVIICAQTSNNLLDGKDSRSGFDAPLTSLQGLYLAQVAIGALGVLVISSEYGTGMIRATMAAVPQRRAALVAKGLTFAVAAFVVGEILSFVSFAVGQGILSRADASAPLTSPDALRAAVGGGLYLTVVGLLGFGMGALIRHTAGALSAFFGVLFALTAVVDLLPDNLRNHLIDYLPPNAGSQILTTVSTGSALGPWAGFGVLCCWAAVPIVVALLLVERRDV